MHEVDTDLMDHNNLMSCQYQHKNLAGFWQAWQLMIKKQSKQQPESLLNHLFRIQMEKDESLAKDLKEYDQKVHKGEISSSYENLCTIVTTELEIREQRTQKRHSSSIQCTVRRNKECGGKNRKLPTRILPSLLVKGKLFGRKKLCLAARCRSQFKTQRQKKNRKL